MYEYVWYACKLLPRHFTPISVWCLALMGIQSLNKGAPSPPQQMRSYRMCYICRIYISPAMWFLLHMYHAMLCIVLLWLHAWPSYHYAVPTYTVMCCVCLHLHSNILTEMYMYSHACHVSLGALRCFHSFPHAALVLCCSRCQMTLPLSCLFSVISSTQQHQRCTSLFISQHVPQPHSHVR